MARSDENMVSICLRMYLSNPQHLKVAKALKKVETEKISNNGLTKNQFIMDAVEYYLDHYYMAEDSQVLVTRKELKEVKQEIREEMQAMLRIGWMHPYPAAFPITENQKSENTGQVEDKPDDTIMDLVSDWD